MVQNIFQKHHETCFFTFFSKHPLHDNAQRFPQPSVARAEPVGGKISRRLLQGLVVANRGLGILILPPQIP